MSISAVANNGAAGQPQAIAQSASSNGTATNGTINTAASASSTTPQTPAAGSDAQSSTVVTLSSQAQDLAKLNADGITVMETSLVVPSSPSGASNIDYAEQVLNATKATVINPPMKDGQYDGVISQSAFETAAEQFGATKAQADQLFASLKTNGSGTISHNDMLSVMGATNSNPSDQTEQALLKLMDTNGDGAVSSNEFLAFEKAMVAAEKPAS
jgi:hypothetical protein